MQNRVRVFVWFVDTEAYTATTSAAAFSDLAVQTGGAYFLRERYTYHSPIPKVILRRCGACIHFNMTRW